jgi:cytosine/adenosine deaminase-related metal-dependent hydrolase
MKGSLPAELRGARILGQGSEGRQDVGIVGGRVVDPATVRGLVDRIVVDLEGRVLMPGLLNGHDHLDFSTFPPLGHPPYVNVYEWARDVDAGAGDPAVTAALAVPLVDRLFLGGLRNLLSGVTAVAHHNPFHRSMARKDFPVRVLEKYEFAHSAGLTPHLRKTYRTTDRRIPWMVHAGEGTDDLSRQEIDKLAEQNVLRQNTVIIHGIAFGADEARRLAVARAAFVWCPESNRRLYGATANLAAFLGAGVMVGLGSDSPVSGVRDPLSNLAAARKEAALADEDLLRLATEGTAAAARLPLGGLAPGSVADLLAVTSREALLSGDRSAVALVLIGGRPLYGERALMTALQPKAAAVLVDGAERYIEPELGRRASGILKRHPALRLVPWLSEVRFSEGDGTRPSRGAP